jgi:hypothetical protein
MKFRWLLPALILTALPAAAEAGIDPDPDINREAPKLRPPLLLVEAEAGIGFSLGGGSKGPSVLRASPITTSLVLDYAIRYKPWISVYGGIRGEAWNRAGLGGLIGLRVRPTRGAFRIGTAFVAMLWPYSIAGIAGHAGACPKVGGTFHLCADAEVTAYVLGGDLPQGRVAAQFQLMLGGAFDAL